MQSNPGKSHLTWFTVVLVTVQPAPTALHYTKSQPIPFLPMHMGLNPNFLSHIFKKKTPFPDDSPNNNKANDRNDLPSSTNFNPHQYPATPNSSQHYSDTNSKSLQHHLDSALKILIQTSGTSADGVTPQVRNTLKAINALVSMETQTYNPPPFKSFRKVTKWLQIPRSPKWNTVVPAIATKRLTQSVIALALPTGQVIITPG